MQAAHEVVDHVPIRGAWLWLRACVVCVAGLLCKVVPAGWKAVGGVA